MIGEGVVYIPPVNCLFILNIFIFLLVLLLTAIQTHLLEMHSNIFIYQICMAAYLTRTYSRWHTAIKSIKTVTCETELYKHREIIQSATELPQDSTTETPRPDDKKNSRK